MSSSQKRRTGGAGAGIPVAARLGIVALQQGATEEALQHLARAVAERPRDGKIMLAYAMALEANRLGAESVVAYCGALARDRRLDAAAIKLGAMLKTYADMDVSKLDEAGLRAAFNFEEVDPLPLARAGFRWLKAAGVLAGPIAQGKSEDWDTAANAVLDGRFRRVLDDPLLGLCLRHGINADPEVEQLLTALRRKLLMDGSVGLDSQKRVYEFACAMVEQCLNNEYVWSVSAEEADALAAGAPDMDGALAGEAAQMVRLLRQALYRSPRDLISESTPAGAFGKIRPRPLAAIFAREIADRATEQALGAEIPAFATPSDDTSRAVAAQYEANPYPRWLRLGRPESGAYVEFLGAFFDDRERARFNEPFKVLIAGCGTGEQTAAAAIGYGETASVLGIDLSRASLGYAARRARDYDLDTVAFHHGDILDLDQLEDRFDIIECVGVLHHMADPIAGWRKLVARLAPGGLMLIGLYSATARRHITAFRSAIAGQGLGSDADTIRRFRAEQLAAATEDADRALILASPEFYGLSTCRDLLFHAHEQPFTIPEVIAGLDALGLEFRGFTLPDARIARFRFEHPDADAWRDLDTWDAFERDHPRTFAGMYQFWCRKPE